MDYILFEAYKRNTTVFKGKTLITFNAASFNISNGDILKIELPINFESIGCALINVKNEHLFLCRSEYQCDEKEYSFPIAYENIDLVTGSNSVKRWLERVIINKCSEEVEYIALLALDFMDKSNKRVVERLANLWSDKGINVIINDLNKIGSLSSKIKNEVINLEQCIGTILEKIDFASNNICLPIIGKLMSVALIKENIQNYIAFVREIFHRITAPATYIDMFSIK